MKSALFQASDPNFWFLKEPNTLKKNCVLKDMFFRTLGHILSKKFYLSIWQFLKKQQSAGHFCLVKSRI